MLTAENANRVSMMNRQNLGSSGPSERQMESLYRDLVGQISTAEEVNSQLRAIVNRVRGALPVALPSRDENPVDDNMVSMYTNAVDSLRGAHDETLGLLAELGRFI